MARIRPFGHVNGGAARVFWLAVRHHSLIFSHSHLVKQRWHWWRYRHDWCLTCPWGALSWNTHLFHDPTHAEALRALARGA